MPGETVIARIPSFAWAGLCSLAHRRRMLSTPSLRRKWKKVPRRMQRKSKLPR
jgi:hypothetical protein